MPAVDISRIAFILDGFLASSFPALPVAWQGRQFSTPDMAIWIRPTCLTGEIEDAEKGLGGYSRRVGLYLIDIFAPSPLETAEAWAVASQAEAVFRRQCMEGIQTEDPRTDNLGVDEYNNFCLRVTVPWWAWAA